MRELSVAEQRYQAVLAVISDGLSVSQVAPKFGVSRQTLHSWLARYEQAGLEGKIISCSPMNGSWRRTSRTCTAKRGSGRVRKPASVLAVS
ncbi:MAG TPA: helix-turn-helix domain-containing protein [Kribbella sp.]|uniref:helix-turn-helix domain-containing protein n=1 Tax=Kribbella sp. TaxID=1871183 RepID=UPI002D76805C|nr:helix-turn-helix domain-containing protein [Kribbella sp.]HET6295249.1 helix-turn-helix domain-containing protein [Kribbella sp.]